MSQASTDFSDPTCQPSQTVIENLSNTVTNNNSLNEQTYNKDKIHKKFPQQIEPGIQFLHFSKIY